jgi:hypothetical protein
MKSFRNGSKTAPAGRSQFYRLFVLMPPAAFAFGFWSNPEGRQYAQSD